MSVAFRRESDEEHREPRFEIPIPPGPNFVTKRGRRLLEDRVADCTAALATAANDEDAEAIRRDLRYWSTRLTTAEIAPAPEDGIVGIGSQVTFRMNGQPRVIEIVGGDEADPAAGMVGFVAPLAHALIGASAGESIAFNGTDDALVVTAVEFRDEEDHA